MKLKRVSPIMTSNTTPSPYVVKESGSYGNNTVGYKAFDAKSGTAWAVYMSSPTWITIDLGVPTKVDILTLANHKGYASPKEFILSGSNDANVYVPLLSQSGVTDWVLGLTKIFNIENEGVAYRYYKFTMVTKNSDGTNNSYAAIAELTLYSLESSSTIISTGGESFTDITPYINGESIVTASSQYSDIYNPSAIFSLIPPVNGWRTEANKPTGFIAIDLLKSTDIDAILIQVSNEADALLTSYPKDMVILGSNDGDIYDEILTPPSQTNWSLYDGRLFKFERTVNCRYIKIIINSNNGADYTGIDIVRLYKTIESRVEPISQKSMSLLSTLPKGTTKHLDSIVGDFREGLLHYANDGNNYGTLRVIGNNGRSMPAKATLNEELIWSGSSTTGTYEGSKFSYLRVVIQNINNKPCSHIIKVNDTVRLAYGNSTSYAYADITFTDTKFTSSISSGSDSTSTTWLSRLLVKEIYGIY